MRVLLISANTETVNMAALPLGLAGVAAATKRAGFETLLLDLMFAEDAESAVRNSVRDFRPDVIGISVRNIDDQNMLAPRFLLPPVRGVVAVCRSASHAPAVLGGAGYSIFPESALDYLGADMGIQGEGEAVFPELAGRIGRGADYSDLPGLCLPGRRPNRRSSRTSLDALPLPEPELWLPAAADGLWVPVQSRRGCPMDCAYCSTSSIEGRSIRRRSAAEVVRWIARIRGAGYRNFTFVDNTFNLPPSYAKELCRRIIEAQLGLNLWCIVYPKWVDRELAELMKAAGCTEVSLGFESGSDGVLSGLNKRFTAAEVAEVSRVFAEAGIPRRGFLMLGAPGDTRETVEESLAFAESLRLDALKVLPGIRIYPNTALAETAAAEGLIAREDDLLMPAFYMAPALREWLPERVAAFKAAHPNVM